MAEIISKKSGFLIRRAQPEDAAEYYAQNYCPLDKEAARLTGSREVFTEEEVIAFFLKSVDDPERCFFLILNQSGEIVGESIINEIDWDTRSANFRICLFHGTQRDKGLGTWATQVTRDYAFEKLKLQRLELEVFTFNPRAKRVYEKAGFRIDGEPEDGSILMAISESEWQQIKESKTADLG